MKERKQIQDKKSNKMKEIRIEKVILSARGIGDDLEKAAKLLELISGRRAVKTKAKKRIPAFGIRPGLEIGCKVTLRGKEAIQILKRLLDSVSNQINERQIEPNGFSFGIEEYIEIPGIEYQRDIGMRGLAVNAVFSRKGKRTEIRKIKKGKAPRRQRVSREEIENFIKDNLKLKIIGSRKDDSE